MTYSEKLKHPKWQKKRLRILERDGFECCNCGDRNSTLEIHHHQYKGWNTNPWDYDDEHLQTLCSKCHRKITDDLKVSRGFLSNNDAVLNLVLLLSRHQEEGHIGPFLYDMVRLISDAALLGGDDGPERDELAKRLSVASGSIEQALKLAIPGFQRIH